MYKEKISRYIDAHRKEMLEDIGALCRINSVKGSYRIGKPYGEGCSEALRTALHIAECYGFAINNYDNYVGTVDMNDKEAQLDILAHLDVVPAGDGWTVTEPFETVVKDGKIYGRGTADDKGPAIAALYASGRTFLTSTQTPATTPQVSVWNMVPCHLARVMV